MTRWELVTEIEDAVEDITTSRTVLGCAMEYFDSTAEEDRKLLPYYADVILRLLSATNKLLFELGRRLDDACTKSEEQSLEE